MVIHHMNIHIAMCLRVLRDALVSRALLQARGLWLEQIWTYFLIDATMRCHSFIRTAQRSPYLFIQIKTVDESNSARVLVGCKAISPQTADSRKITLQSIFQIVLKGPPTVETCGARFTTGPRCANASNNAHAYRNHIFTRSAKCTTRPRRAVWNIDIVNQAVRLRTENWIDCSCIAFVHCIAVVVNLVRSRC